MPQPTAIELWHCLPGDVPSAEKIEGHMGQVAGDRALYDVTFLLVCPASLLTASRSMASALRAPAGGWTDLSGCPHEQVMEHQQVTAVRRCGSTDCLFLE